MPSEWDDAGSKDWGGSEVHDWGVDQPSEVAPTWEVGEQAAIDPLSPEDSDPDDEDPIADYVVLAMENLQHSVTHPNPEEEDPPPFYWFGSGDGSIYAIEDGPSHCMIGRAVGQDTDDCVYCLVGRSPSDVLGLLDGGDLLTTDAFADAQNITLCSVFDADDVSNVVIIQTYQSFDEVPDEYRPGRSFLAFTDE